MTSAQALANAIIIQAVDDYREARKELKYHRLTKEERKIHNETLEEVEEFFLGDWFKDLTNLDGAKLFERLKNEPVCNDIAVIGAVK